MSLHPGCRVEGQQPFIQASGKGPWLLPFSGDPPLGSWIWGSRFTASLPQEQRQGLMAVLCRPQGDAGCVLVGLWNRSGRAEHDVCAGGRWHGGASNCWALLRRREAACP